MSENQSMSTQKNDSHTSPNTTNTSGKDQANAAASRTSNTSFWTKCSKCCGKFEYSTIYLDKMIQCPNCRTPFIVLGVPKPFSSTNSISVPTYSQQYNASGSAGVESSTRLNVGHVPFFRSGVIQSRLTSITSPSHLVQPASVDLKRKNEGEQTPATSEKHPWKKINSSVESGTSLATNFRSISRIGDGPYRKPNSIKELSKTEISDMLAGKARMEIRKKLNEWNAATQIMNTEGKEIKRERSIVASHKVEKATLHVSRKDGNMEAAKSDSKSEKYSLSIKSDEKVVDYKCMSVPDSDFHDFDKERSEKSFGKNEVWAAYDDTDGMPRFYALIREVKKRPFSMTISWLNSRSSNEFGSIDWVGSGFYKTSGDFKVGKREVNNRIHSFSHRVSWTKGKHGAYQIYPKKGDVWALYRNWSADWNPLTRLETIQKYEMVEVLEDYAEERGVNVVTLVKVPGFKSVWQHHLDPRQVRTIPKQEMFRFSHQIYSYLLTGEEAANVPKGSRELDPAAMPLELLQVITEVQDLETQKDAENFVKVDEPAEEVTKMEECPKEAKIEAEAMVNLVQVTKHVKL